VILTHPSSTKNSEDDSAPLVAFCTRNHDSTTPSPLCSKMHHPDEKFTVYMHGSPFSLCVSIGTERVL